MPVVYLVLPFPPLFEGFMLFRHLGFIFRLFGHLGGMFRLFDFLSYVALQLQFWLYLGLDSQDQGTNRLEYNLY